MKNNKIYVFALIKEKFLIIPLLITTLIKVTEML